VDSSHKLEEIPADELRRLKTIAAPAFAGMRLPSDQTWRMIPELGW
jgi:hypothetical protein